jgi:hypothetical protein
LPDGPLLGRNAKGVLAAIRESSVGELYRYHLNRLDWMDGLARGNGGRRRACAASGIRAGSAGLPAD